MAERTPEVTSIKQPERAPVNVGDKSGGESYCQRTGGSSRSSRSLGRKGSRDTRPVPCRSTDVATPT